LKGRKPKPSHLHLINGNPGKRKRNRNEPKPQRGIPSPPEHLSKKQAVAWGAMSVKLDEMGVLTVADGWALERLAGVYAEILEWQEIIADDGRMIEQLMSDGETVRKVVNPACIALSDADKRFKAYMAEFGLTPSARSRVNVKPPDEEKEDPAKKYFG